ncbi:MAG: hypothetical protein ACHQD9_01835 [Chitinophagales bacterium]
MKSKGRPATAPIKFMDGFYVEVRNKGSLSKGVIIRSPTKEAMEFTIKQYERSNKDVIVLGEHKNFEWVNEKSAGKKNTKAASKREKKQPSKKTKAVA